MKRALASFGVALIIFIFVFYAWSEKTVDPKRLTALGGIEVHIASGAAEVVGKPVSDIRVTIVDVSPELARQASIRIDRNQKPILVDISDLPHMARAYIEVPESSSITVSMHSGELKIEGIRGDIYALLRSGSMIINVGSISHYSSANGFVLAGSLEARAFGVDKGGIWRMFRWNGTGKCRIDAHVTMGELILE